MKILQLFIFFILCYANCLAQAISHPQFDRTDNPALMIERVEFDKDTTYIYCIYNADGGTWANISKETVLKDCLTGQILPILRCSGLPFAPESRIFQFPGKYNIVFCFPKKETTMTKFDFIESEKENGFNIYGVDLECSIEDSLYTNNLEYAISLSNRAEFFSSAGNYDKAIELEEQAMNIKKAYLGCKSPGYATSVLNLAWYYSKGGYYEKAITWGNVDLKLCVELLGTNNEAYGVSLLNLGFYYHSYGKYSEAESYEKQAVELYLKLFGEESQQYAEAISSLAQTLYAQGRNNEAIEYEAKALEIRERLFGKESTEYAMSLHSLSLGYAAIGDILKAIDFTTEAINIKRNTLGTHDPNYIMSLNNLASFYSMKNEYEKACDIEEEALQLSETVYGSNHPEYAKIIGNLGGYYIQIGKTEKAVTLLEKAHQLNRQFYGEDSEIYAISLNNLSQLYSQLHNYEKAISYGNEALQIFPKDNLNYITLLTNMAHNYACINDYAKAITFQQEAITVTKAIMTTEFNELDVESKYLFWQKTHGIFDDDYPSYVAKNKTSSTLSDLYNSILFSKGIILRKDVQLAITWRDIQKNLLDDDIVIEFISPIMSTNDTIKFYALTIRKGYESPKMIELFDIWQLNDSLANACSNFDKDLTVGNLVWDPLESELVNVKNIYFSPTHVLHNIAIEYLPKDSLKYYSDVFSIHRLSSSGLLANQKRNTKHSKAILYGGLKYEPSDELISSTKVSLKRSGFEPLFNTEIEVSDIHKILYDAGIDVSEFTNVSGTELSFRNLSGKPIDILHLATHGMYIKTDDIAQKTQNENYTFIHSDSTAFYQSDALTRAFLVFSNGNNLAKRISTQETNDGIVTALDISRMDFSGVDIVTLSACESALGEYGSDDGILGLQRGFKIAGANTILMSLNKVDDEATKILMVEFYKNLMSGKSKHQSFKEAQGYLRKVDNGKYDDPKYWASFIMLDGLN